MFFFVCTVFLYFSEFMHNFKASFVLGKVERKLATKHGLKFFNVVAVTVRDRSLVVEVKLQCLDGQK